jgi:hypothetical protein
VESERTGPSTSSYVLLGVVVLAAGALAYGIWRGLEALDPGVAAALIAATATVLISVVSLILQRRWEQRRAIEEAQREHKRVVYVEFIDFLFRSATDPPGEAEIERFIKEFSPKLILWGGEAVLSEYGAFRATAIPETEEAAVNAEILFAFERVLYAVRRDLGHPDKDLRRGDLLRLYINDVDDYL